MDNQAIKKLEADLWESADLLRAGSKLTSQQYCSMFVQLDHYREVIYEHIYTHYKEAA